MELKGELFSAGVGLWFWLVYLALLFNALRLAAWRGLLGENRLHLFLGTCVALVLLWSVRAEVNAGLSFHLLGLPVVTLMFGWSFGMLAGSLALLGVNLNLGGGWGNYALNALVLVAVPVSLTQAALVLARSLLPKNFFIYVLVNGFLAAGLVMVVTCYLAAGLLVLGGVYEYAELDETFLLFVPLMAMPEAFLNGWIITVMVAMRPQWVYSFSDAQYIKGK
ncbi:MAG: molecular chaperone DnaJ [Candidatus Sedimenticola endophacoides]|uniref:Molecular chaperone DnaJ n=1 Tax=Candidatus Sedimenticola endophacoides TaxID=2548426 RepID=A0A657PSG4_9GAMM|nr:MAG: molecular chaperone DnaJ [Candidatus Sedimenticola endophacoides]OQX37750.1 MAG: molecular chaperone DnaJ [Candidatus Sedimenticola endophacoides]OQX39025.1 MAG: molecular chaperone DnaJ [Candidatus Sedimenticola endophacoides]OQX42423.1 MAG: molecular chaperone DnaJ [Candidatus Sedimenticola endophacoides]OQX47860.1 MAG: molecular chaperone DnaJ [Candidatus Sedimenticola endophacoides]